MSNNLENDEFPALAMANSQKGEKTLHWTATPMSNIRLLRPDMDTVKQALKEKRRVADLEAEWYKHKTLLALLRRDRPALEATFKTACAAWAAKDPTAYALYWLHYKTANKCSTVGSRIWQIVLWVRANVPYDVRMAAHALADSHGEEAGVHDMTNRVKHDLGFDVAYPDYEKACLDDSLWTARKIRRQDSYCFEIGEIGDDLDLHLSSVNGFCNYVPKGEGADMLQHLAANFEARKNFLADNVADAPAYPHPRLWRPMKKFINSAMVVLDLEQTRFGGRTLRMSDLRTALIDFDQILTTQKDEAIRAWAKHCGRPEHEYHERDCTCPICKPKLLEWEHPADSDSGSECSFVSKTSFASWNHKMSCDCTDCVESANRRRPSFQDDWIFEQDEDRHADRVALEARHAAAHGDDTEEELNARLIELRSSPGAAVYRHERIMVELHLHRLSEQMGSNDDVKITGEEDGHYAEWLAL